MSRLASVLADLSLAALCLTMTYVVLTVVLR
jgi:hypothetical protein